MRRSSLFPKKLRVITGLGVLVLLLVGWSAATTPVKGPHSPLELSILREQIQGLDVQFGTYFVTAGRCSGCHGHDSLGIAMVAEERVEMGFDARRQGPAQGFRQGLAGGDAGIAEFFSRCSNIGL